ncbi:MAG: LysM peptidoglycan-binding domain-containing protein [Methylococcales bacterium]|jgi:membrane-bound lytic murein transglycosylase D|nr:LysM peptidoglycan-binding domain-containing protein [Methylococcales bacterium]
MPNKFKIILLSLLIILPTPSVLASLIGPITEKTDVIWPSIINSFKFNQSNSRIDNEIKKFSKSPKSIHKILKRATPYLYHIHTLVKSENIPGEIALLPYIESGFRPFAYSQGQASGLWQFIPSTGRMLNLKQNWWFDQRRDVSTSTKAALKYLLKLNKQFNGDWMLTLSAYNAGSGTIRKAMRLNNKKQKPTDYWSLNLSSETSRYVAKLIAICKLIKNNRKFAIQLPNISNKVYYQTIEINHQIDLALAAEAAEISLETLYKLNPAFNQWATPPSLKQISLPVDKIDIFKLNLSKIPKKQRIKWSRYQVKPRDSLIKISKKYLTSEKLIRQVNHLKSSKIQVGKYLIIPVASKDLSSYALSSLERKKHNLNRKRKGIKLSYQVKQGDTLWGIAQQYNISSSKLARWNAMSPKDTLKSRQKIFIWVLNKKPPLPNQKNAIQKIYYTIKNGDTLSSISNKFNISINDICTWNNINRKKLIHPGQKLTLIIDVRNT